MTPRPAAFVAAAFTTLLLAAPAVAKKPDGDKAAKPVKEDIEILPEGEFDGETAAPQPTP